MKYKTEIEVDISHSQLAEMFIGWGDDQQAGFFNLIGKHFKAAEFSAETQCCYISGEVDQNGKDFIYTLANFLKVQKIPCSSPKEATLLNSYPGGL